MAELIKMKRQKPPGLASDKDTLAVNWTTFTAAINAAVHLGAKRIVLLGADSKRGADGRCHHHAPHRWPLRDANFAKQRADLQTLVAPLRARNIEVINCSPGSALTFWPVMSLSEYLDRE